MKSIRATLSASLLAAALLTALVLGAVTYRFTLRENEALFDDQLRQIALSLRDHGFTLPSPAAGANEDESSQVVVQIWTLSGAIVYLSDARNPVPNRAVAGFADMVTDQGKWRVFGLPAGDRIIQVAQPLDLRRDLAAAAALRSLLPLLAFAFLMALLIWWLVARSLLPLRRLAEEVSRRDAKSLDKVTAQHLPAEIEPLAGALNAMLERLRRAFARQRAFVADAAHELRSPLAALKIQLQLLERARDDAARAEARARLAEGMDRAAHLVDQLLAAARTDPDDAASAFEETDLAEAVREVIAALHVVAEQKGIEIALEAPERLQLAGDPQALTMLARNLIDNAIRYTPAGGQVMVRLSSAQGHVELVVEDSGPGIPEADRPRAFDRFYRGTGETQGGSGLGLAIVKNVVDMHRAAIKLGVSTMGGLKVEVTFPQDAAPGFSA
ncbi:ATP-binding protein [Noviherbaspirillum galbum]|uniref:histidine kinase n=1 Tax=Noviherbaspirillum galbum TaxID=2709383 RepID=A0A6B3SFE1_9BURK|nr:ATP-binding protein [Noviherbaspirillum galbum]NEX59541.1 HAMP domain-containing protein [Noviherbaspirillum galbum]